MNCPRDGSLLTLVEEYVGDLYEYNCPRCGSTFEAFDDAEGLIHVTETAKDGPEED